MLIKASDLKEPVLHWVIIKLRRDPDKPLFGTMEACSVDEVTDRIVDCLNSTDFFACRNVVVRSEDVESFEVHLVRERTY